MQIREIHYDKPFVLQFKKLPHHIKEKVIAKEKIFRDNPFHPSLRLHKLQGKLDGHWSISIDNKYRIIFKIKDGGNYLLISIGTHAIYGK